METRARLGIAATFLLFAASCGREAARPPTTPKPGTPVSFEGVSFTLDLRIAPAATSARVDACPLQNPDDKPDGVAPAHVAIRLGADAGAPRPCSVPDLGRAGLYVFSAAEYGRTRAPAAASLRALEKLLAARAMPADGSLPFVPFVDASFAVAERASFVDFQGGTGVLVLVELAIEPDTLGDELLLVFQGLSRDRARYVLGLFPVTRAPAPKRFAIDPHALYDEQARAFEPYRREVARALAAARDEDFVPRPSWLRAMLATLRL
jgi:hypothetical protein